MNAITIAARRIALSIAIAAMLGASLGTVPAAAAKGIGFDIAKPAPAQRVPACTYWRRCG